MRKKGIQVIEGYFFERNIRYVDFRVKSEEIEY